MLWSTGLTGFSTSGPRTGTQDIVKNDERFLFISLHRFDHADFYPSKLESNFSVASNVINIPWNGGPMSDKEYMTAFCNLVLPLAYNFNPELVLVSAGFDGAIGRADHRPTSRMIADRFF